MYSRRAFMTAIAASASLAALPVTALAQAPKKGPHGGMVGGSGGHEVELVIAGADVSIYVLEAGKVSPVGKAQLRMVVQSGGKTVNHPLTVAAADRLAAKLPDALPKGSIVVISGRDDHGHSVSARFTIP